MNMENVYGWLGVVLIHGATIPTLYSRLLDGGDSLPLPHVSLVLMVWAGLICYFVRECIGRRDTVYLVSNGIGFVFNSLLLTLIVFN